MKKCRRVEDAVGNSYTNIAIIIVLVLSLLFRWAVSVGPYSGSGQYPMYGDFEAQRHWMEITWNLPLDTWYENTTNNDLQYWGLDYPPLTAYHSWLMGYVADKLNASWVRLFESRGLESYHHKLFMRYTVVAADCLTLIPAILLYTLKCIKVQDSFFKYEILATWLLYPGLLLIDHGHFQYNCVSLGFFLFAFICFIKRYDVIGAVFFVAALNYKQMELYHALPTFAFLFGTCLHLPLSSGMLKFVMLSVSVLVSFFVIWLPFLKTVDGLLQVLLRLFPLDRGIFEDKVANFWCASSVVFKWRRYFDNGQMALICLVTTLLLCLPSIALTLWRPKIQNLKLSLVITSFVFYLFSFQVHEKSILLVAVPALISFENEPFAVGWFLLISVLSLFPLAVKDGMQVAFFALFIAYYVWITDVIRFGKKPNNPTAARTVNVAFHISIVVGFLLCVSSMLISPPIRYPDLFTVLISLYCCLHFCSFLVLFYCRQFVGYSLKSKSE